MSIPTKSLEFLLETWRDHSKTGFHVTFLVNPQDQEFFKACADGQRFTAVLVKLTDDEKPAPLPTAADLKREEAARAKRGAAEAKAHNITVKELEAQKPLPIPEPDHAPAHHKFPTGLCGLAVKWCGDEHFQRWVKHTYGADYAEVVGFLGVDAEPEQIVKQVLCDHCNIHSRKELDTDTAAEATFRCDFMGPYVKQREEDGIDDAPF